MPLDRSTQSRSLDEWNRTRRPGSTRGIRGTRQRGRSVTPVEERPGWPACPHRNDERIGLLEAAFVSERSRCEIRGLSEKPRRALDGSLDEWFEGAAWSVMNVSPRRPLFRGSLAFLKDGAELGLSDAHRKLEMLGYILVELLESRRLLASTQNAIVGALTLMLVRNRAFRTRYLAGYSAAAERIINTPAVPVRFKARVVESIYLVFASSRLPDHESALQARLLKSIRDSLLGILTSRSTARCKTPVLYVFNWIVGERMLDGRVGVPTDVLRDTYTMWLHAHVPSPLRERALAACAVLRRVSPDVMAVIAGILQGEYDAVTDAVMRLGRRRGRRGAVEAVLRHIHLSRTMSRESRQELGKALVSLVCHSRDRQSIRTSLRILASDRFWPELGADEHAEFRRAVESLVLDTGRAHDMGRAAIDILSRWEPAIEGPPVVLNGSALPEISLASVLERMGGGECRRIGTRSLRVDLENRPNECLLVKTIPPGDDVSGLLRECFWVEHLGRIRSEKPWGHTRFDIPTVVDVAGQKTFALSGAGFLLPGAHPREARPAIGLVVPREYFDYVNSLPRYPSGPDRLTEVLTRGGYLLGVLLSMGIIHCDVIPLFHRSLRRPPISFQWWLGGRICTWEAFCRYPNMGRTGIRDFEHLISWRHDPAPEGYSGPGALYKLIGAHILSLLLLIGSALRGTGDGNAESAAEGDRPGDFRARFDSLYLGGLLRDTLGSYYRGLTGSDCPFWGSIDCDRVAAAIRDTMGRDLRMSSRFRKEDQVTVQADEFREILRAGGYAPEVIEGIEKGRHDLYVIDGPHLEEGSAETLPAEIRRAVEVFAGLCYIGLLRAKRCR